MTNTLIYMGMAHKVARRTIITGRTYTDYYGTMFSFNNHKRFLYDQRCTLGRRGQLAGFSTIMHTRTSKNKHLCDGSTFEPDYSEVYYE